MGSRAGAARLNLNNFVRYCNENDRAIESPGDTLSIPPWIDLLDSAII